MFKKIRHIHFVGIGGSGMSGIAEVLLKLGYQISGSDMSRSAVVERLEGLGATIFKGHVATNTQGADVVVTSTAIDKKNPEVQAAHKAGIPVIRRIEMLAELARLKYTIAVSGTHGKTTTTSLTAQILTHAQLDPTVIVGGRLKNVGTGGVLGAGDYMVAEADESDGSFLMLSPTISIVTNIDDDHLDYYKTMGRLEDAFVMFAGHIPFYGATYLCGEDPGVRRILPRLTRRFAVYGFNKKFDIYATDVTLDETGSRFTVVSKEKVLGKIWLPLAGQHNVLNALAAIAVALHIDVPFEKISEALAQFGGVGRRIEFKGDANGVAVVDDYGHHPTEIKATLAGVKARWPRRRLVVLFQPHRYSRTQLLWKQFAQVLGMADKVYLLPIYPAGEKPLRGVTTKLIAKAMKKKNWALVSREKVLEDLKRDLVSGDVLLTLGAGDVWKTGEALVQGSTSLAGRISTAFPDISRRIRPEEPLGRHCTWGIGGPAEAYVEIHTLVELQNLLRWCRGENIPFFLLGWGSNVLFPDEGLRGVVVRLRGEFEDIQFGDRVVRVGAGVHLPKLAKICAEKKLFGVEALAGVPGTVGGALIMNAGTPRGVIGDVVSAVGVLESDGSVSNIPKDQISFGYRTSSLRGRWIVSAELDLKPAGEGDPMELLKAELAHREKTQPLGTKNAGSVFRNPPYEHAAELIESVGLKGKQVGRMRISPKHANFIENTGGGTAQEALELIGLVQKTVRQKFGIELELEVILIKQPEPWA